LYHVIFVSQAFFIERANLKHFY